MKTSQATQKRNFKIPHVYVLLSIMILIAFVATFVIPSGEFDRIKDESTGRTLVVSNSYHHVEKKYLGPLDLPMSVVGGLQKASKVIFFVLLIGGAFKVITDTHVFRALTSKIAKKFGNNTQLLIPIFILFFSVLGFTMGASQEVIIFVPIGIAVARALGYDAITGMAMMQLGAMCGFTAGLFNPFNVGVAQSIAQLPLYSGLWLRVVILFVYLTITILFIMAYARKVKVNPASSLCYDLECEEQSNDYSENLSYSLTKRHISILCLLFLGLALLIYGIKVHDWFINEMSAIFLVIGILSGIIGKMHLAEIADSFVKGAESLMFGALIIGLATAIVVVLSKGGVLDTIINSIFGMVSLLPRPLQGVGIYFSQIFINFFIISGTGQAAVVMPILSPLGDLLGISRQTMVLAFQLGDGFTNSFFPTSATLMAVLSVAKIKYDKWFEFVLPLMLILVGISAVFVILADLINYA